MRRFQFSVPIPMPCKGCFAVRRRQRLHSLARGNRPGETNSRQKATGSAPLTAGCGTLGNDCRRSQLWLPRRFIIFPLFRMATSPKATHPAPQDATTPAAVVRCGKLSAAVFKRMAKAKNGDEFATFQVSLRRSYQDGEGQWQHTHTLHEEDLLAAAFTLTQCYERIMAERGEPRE